jgi:hypothetical protein
MSLLSLSSCFCPLDSVSQLHFESNAVFILISQRGRRAHGPVLLVADFQAYFSCVSTYLIPVLVASNFQVGGAKLLKKNHFGLSTTDQTTEPLVYRIPCFRASLISDFQAVDQAQYSSVEHHPQRIVSAGSEEAVQTIYLIKLMIGNRLTSLGF